MNIYSTFQSKIPCNKLVDTIFVFLLAFACCTYFGRNILADPDTGWHIKAGEIIWNTFRIPIYDTLTFTADQQWYNLSWLWDVIIYQIYNAFGLEGLTWAQSMLYALVVMSTYITMLNYNRFNNDTIAIATAIGALLIWDLLYFRPQLITYIFATCILYMLSIKHKFANYFIPLIVILWANVHGSFIVSYTIIVGFGIGAYYEKDYIYLRKLILLFMICIVVCMINPLGYKIFIAISRTMNSAITMYIKEWLPFTWGREYSFTLVLLLIITLGGFNKKSIPLSYRIIAFCWLIVSLQSKRSFGYFGVLSLPYFCYLVEGLTINSPSKYYPTYIMKIFAIFALMITTMFQPYFNFKVNDFSTIPLKAINILNQKCHNAQIFNDYNYGGYLALWINNDIKYFIDGRAGTSFSENFIKSYLKATLDNGNIGELMKQNSIDAAIISSDLKGKSSYALYFLKWDLVYLDEHTAVYFNKFTNACRK